MQSFSEVLGRLEGAETVDYWNWQMKKKKEFGDAIKAILEKFQKYTHLLNLKKIMLEGRLHNCCCEF